MPGSLNKMDRQVPWSRPGPSCDNPTLSKSLRWDARDLAELSMVSQEKESQLHRAAAIAHDLSGAIHVLAFCIEFLQRSPSQAVFDKYLRQMSSSCAKAEGDLVALRSALATERSHDRQACLRKVCGEVVQCLEIKYFHGSANNITSLTTVSGHGQVAVAEAPVRFIIRTILSALYQNLAADQGLNHSLRVDCRDNGEAGVYQCAISISDQGRASEYLEKLFDGFSVCRSQDHDQPLSLGILKYVIDSVGATVSFSRKPLGGDGPELSLYLPIARESTHDGSSGD